MITREIFLALAAVLIATGAPAAGPVCRTAQTTADVNSRMVIASLDMRIIPAGGFSMGADGADAQQGFPQHHLSVAAFRIASTETTFAQYDRYSRATRQASAQDEGFGRQQRPVINISRLDALRFIQWLNAKSGRHFRLPSEAEWEYAAHGGADSIYSWGDRLTSDYANTADDRGQDHFIHTAPVASFLPNAYGLYDMAGNVWELTADCRHENYQGAPTDGSAWMDRTCDSYVVRGGYYGSITRGIRPTARSAASDSFRSMSMGFRLAEDIGTADTPACSSVPDQAASAG